MRLLGSVTNSSGLAPCLAASDSSHATASSCSWAVEPRLSTEGAGLGSCLDFWKSMSFDQSGALLGGRFSMQDLAGCPIRSTNQGHWLPVQVQTAEACGVSNPLNQSGILPACAGSAAEACGVSNPLSQSGTLPCRFRFRCRVLRGIQSA